MSGNLIVTVKITGDAISTHSAAINIVPFVIGIGKETSSGKRICHFTL